MALKQDMFSRAVENTETQLRVRCLWFIALLVSAVLFSAAPQIDIVISSLFYWDGGFIGSRSTILEAVRQVIWTTASGVGLFALFGLLVAVLRGSFLGSSGQIWNIVVTVYVLGPGVMANLLLKSYWGRARPVNVMEFGGSADFTPALLATDACAANCSFVSGEASGATAAAVAIWLFSAPIPTLWLRNCVRGFAIAIAVVGSGLRVVAGGHFMSDVVFAVLIVTGLAVFLLWYRGRAAKENASAQM